MKIVRDDRFVRTLYTNFCRRPASGRLSRLAIQAQRVQIHEQPDPVLRRVLVLSVVDGGEGSLMDIAWTRNVAVPLRAMSVNRALLDAGQRELSSFVRRFLLKHGVIDRKGATILPEVA